MGKVKKGFEPGKWEQGKKDLNLDLNRDLNQDLNREKGKRDLNREKLVLPNKKTYIPFSLKQNAKMHPV